MGCALTSPRFGARAAPGLGEGRLGAPRRPRLRRRGRGGAPGAAIHWLVRLAPPLGERPEARTCVLTAPGGGAWTRRCRRSANSERPEDAQPGLQGPAAEFRPPSAGLRRSWVSMPHRGCCARVGHVRRCGSGPLAGASPGERPCYLLSSIPSFFPPLFLLASPSRLLACQTACCLPAEPRSTAAQSCPLGLPSGVSDFGVSVSLCCVPG